MKAYAYGLPSSLFLAFIALGTLPGEEVRLKVTATPAEPGEGVVVEFRSTLSQPVVDFEIHFQLTGIYARFLRTQVWETASAGASGTNIISRIDHLTGAFISGVRSNPIGPGEDLLLVKAVLQLLPGTPPGEVDIAVLDSEFVGRDGQDLSVKIENTAVLKVLPRTRPTPVRIFRCRQSGEEVLLTWHNTEVYDSLHLSRDGGPTTRLNGTDTSFRDRPPPGHAFYRLSAVRGGKESFQVNASTQVRPILVPEIRNLICAPDQEKNHLQWDNGGKYDSILVLRNDREIALLEGTTRSYDDPVRSDSLFIYKLLARSGGLDTLPATCRVNEFSPEFTYWAEEVRARPGDRQVPVRIFATSSDLVQGMGLGFRIDPAWVTMRRLTLEQTASESVGYQYFAYLREMLGIGQTTAGIVFMGIDASHGYLFPPGRDQQVMTILMDIKPDAPQGTVVPVEIGAFGNPQARCGFTIDGLSELPETRSGAILIGASPVPEIENLAAEVKQVEQNLAGGGGEAAQSVALSWTNLAAYSSIRIERDGREIGVLEGGSDSFFDSPAGTGRHRYRVIPWQGDRQGFPAVAIALPAGASRTFLRGDTNSDGRVNISDPIAILKFLLFGERQPACQDAGDADDSGCLDLSDSIVVLKHLFEGGTPLPAPGSRSPWFDPTPDDLACN